MKKTKITGVAKITPRDRNVQPMLQRKSGAHVKSGKALRKAERMAFWKKMKSGLSEVDFARA